jgi:hypothetical protein
VTGLDDEYNVDLEHGTISIAPLESELGSNGWLSTAAYDTLGASVRIPPMGELDDDDGCLLIARGDALTLHHDEAMYVTLVENSTYFVQVLDREDDFPRGFEAEICIRYDESLVAAAQGGELDENVLTVRRWTADTNELTGRSISHVSVDTEENKVCFKVSDLHYTEGAEDHFYPMFALVVPDYDAPVVVTGICPYSPYAGRFNYTSNSPDFSVYVREVGGQQVDPLSIEILMTMGPDSANQEWVTVGYVLDEMDGGSDYGGYGDGYGDYVTWTLPGGFFSLEKANADGSLYYLEYEHPFGYPTELVEGWHKFNVRFKPANGPESWIELIGHGSPYEDFFVDTTPPEVLFVSGFVQNPLFRNVAGYFNPWAEDYQNMLTVWMWDAGSGIHFASSEEVDCWEDDSFRYDLWLIDREDDQDDVDEIEERVLLHTGTPGELVPWVEPKLEVYNPGEDTLTVRLPIVGDSIIKHGDVIEVTLYSDKDIEENGEITAGCTMDSLIIGNDVVIVTGGNCHLDVVGQEMHIYRDGIEDYAGNGYRSGSPDGEEDSYANYIEARFIVDLKGPAVTFNMPERFNPEDGLWIDIELDDSDSGLEDIGITVTGPGGEELECEELTIEDGHLTCHIDGPLPQGTYTVVVTGTDRVGNRTIIRREFRVESEFLTMTQSFSAPNPFNPEESNAGIHFTLSKASEVTIKVYDFGGDFVSTISNRELFAAGENVVEWGGEAADGTDLANGAYICRIRATDGARTEESNLKVVIWRE